MTLFLRWFSVLCLIGAAFAASRDCDISVWVTLPLFAVVYVLAGGLSLWVKND